jgi:hypothetical protein
MTDCPIFLRRKVAEWIPAAENLRQIEKKGPAFWLKEQKKRRKLLEELLENFNDGRSMSLYCKVCSRMPIDSIGKAIKEAKGMLAAKKTDPSDVKGRAEAFKAVISDSAIKANISLD